MTFPLCLFGCSSRRAFPLYAMVLCWTCLLCLASGEPANGQETFRIAAVENLDDSYEYIIELLENTYENLGFKAEVILLPAERALREANSGHFDAVDMRLDTIDRYAPNLVRIPVVLEAFPAQLYGRANLHYHGPDDLKNIRLVTILGIKYQQDIVNQFGLSPIQVKTPFSVVEMILRNRADAVIVNPKQADHYRFLMHAFDIVPLGPPLATVRLYHWVHKKHAALVPAITAELERQKKLMPEHFVHLPPHLPENPTP